MKNVHGDIIYVGKAISLKNRVKQYFQSNSNMNSKVRAMVSHIEEFEYIITDSEMEALILENNLIKEYKPQYNILLRDDKTYPYIKITLDEDFPRVYKTRQIKKDGARYFGPYSNAFVVNDIIDMIYSTFKIRNCNRNIKKSIEKKERACLNYYIKTCSAPCLGIIKKEEYNLLINEVIEFLESKNDKIIENLTELMNIASKNMEFEKAIIYREKIKGMKLMLEKQKIVSTTNLDDKDFIAIEKSENNSCIFIFFVRNGKVVGTENFIFDKKDSLDKIDTLESFLKQYYINSNYIPKEIYLNESFDDINLLSMVLSSKKNSKVSLKVPQKGDKKDMINLAIKNAKDTLCRKEAIIESKKNHYIMIENELKDILNISKSIKKIESYDISNIQGVDSVGGQIVFLNGKKEPKLYRRYKIKTVEGPNDYKSMEEIISRRIKYEEFPDLILLDGGKGQVNVIKKLLKKESLDIPVFGMFKDDNHKTYGLCDENQVYEIKSNSSIYRFISSIQEEVHRFAIDYHRTLRDKKLNFSILDNIPGVGDKRKKILLKKFKSIDNIKNATLEEILNLKGIDKKTANEIYNYFNILK